MLGDRGTKRTERPEIPGPPVRTSVCFVKVSCCAVSHWRSYREEISVASVGDPFLFACKQPC